MSTENNEKQFKVYSNEVQIAMSFADFCLQFRLQSTDGIEVLGSVLLSPQHTKSLANILNQNIAQYEEFFGEIPVLDQEKFRQLQSMGIMGGEPQ